MQTHHARRTRIATGIFIGALLSACKVDNESGKAARPPAKPVSSATSVSALRVASGVFDFDDALVRKILDTAGTLTKKDWDDKHDRIDQRRLLTGTCGAFSSKCEPGPFVRIVARSVSHQTKRADLGAGHIVGKLVTFEQNGAIPYEKLALYTGTGESYWWIGLHKVPSNADIDTISVYVPADWGPGKPATWRAASLMDTDPGDPTFKHHHPMARFVWNDNDDETWVTCVTNGCCQPPMAFDTLETTRRTQLDNNRNQ